MFSKADLWLPIDAALLLSKIYCVSSISLNLGAKSYLRKSFIWAQLWHLQSKGLSVLMDQNSDLQPNSESRRASIKLDALQ